MGKIRYPNPTKLIFSIISNQDKLFWEAKKLLVDFFGEIDLESEYQAFNFTNYYRDEMGDQLKQKLISFEKLILPERLSQVKCDSNRWEFLLSTGSNSFTKEEIKRKVNLDPGYLTLHKFILASTKNGPARIYLKKGIYAEITLRFIKKSYHPLEWTYQNYQTESYISFFNKVREVYKKQIKEYIREKDER